MVWHPSIATTTLRKSQTYSFYYVTILTPVFLGILPFGALIVFNCAIYHKIKLPAELIPEHRKVNKRRLEKEINLARILVWIVSTFILCHGIRLFIDIHEMSVIDKIQNCSRPSKVPPWLRVLLCISKLMVVINSSINMIIYCCLSPRFRKLITPFKRKALRSYFTTGTVNARNETETTKCEGTVNVHELQSMRTARKVYI